MYITSLAAAAAQTAGTFDFFDFYKNSGFSPCTGVFPTPQDLEFAGVILNPDININFLIFPTTIGQFCAAFGDFEVLPTTPHNNAFYITWLTYLISFITNLISAITLALAFRKSKGGETKKSTLSKIFFWLVTSYSAVAYVWWWVQFITFARNKEMEPSPNVIDWIGVFNYYFSLQGTELQFYQWIGLLLGIPQMIATLYITGFRFPTTRLDDNEYLQKIPGDYFLKDGYQPSTNVRCPISAFDPRLFNDRNVLRASRAQAVVGLTQFLFTVYVWFSILLLVFVFKGCCGKLNEKLRSRKVWMRTAWLTMILTAVSCSALNFRMWERKLSIPHPCSGIQIAGS